MLPPVPIAKSHSLSTTSQSLAYPPPPTDIRFPSMAAPPMDPSAVDFRAFYPYTPNEVKHRKRTTSDQLKILEGIFKRDTKPNAALRNELAARLDMTPRGVQVWFQNRRAKEKTKAGKAANRAAAAVSGDNQNNDLTSSPSDPDGISDSQLPSYLRDIAGLGGSHESSPVAPSPPRLHVFTEADSSTSSSWQSSPIVTPEDPAFLGQLGDPNDAHRFRRGSLPVDMVPHSDHSSQGPPLVGHLDPFARRLSVDASLHRLASNPYAHLARTKNTTGHGSRLASHSNSRHPLNRVSGIPYPRPELPHIASAPSNGSFHGRHVSADSRGFHYTSQGIPVPSFHAARASLPDSHLYAFSSRMSASTIPGPLPSPDFSFGVASTSSPSLTPPSSADSERSSPDPNRSFTFQSEDSEDDRTSSYEALSRFGSIASVATSDTSNASVYYSDCMEQDIPPNASRRESGSSNHFLGMMSNLDVSGLQGNSEVQGSPMDKFSPPGDGSGAAATQDRSDGDDVATSTYPSPSSTVSPGSTPSLVNEGTSSNLPLSRSSELAYALHNHRRATDGSIADDTSQSASNVGGHQFVYGVSDPAFQPSTSSSQVTDSFRFDTSEHSLSADCNYTMNYPDVYAVDAGFPSHNTHVEGGEMNNNAIAFNHSQEMYGSYGPATNSTPLENPPRHTAEFPVTYSS
ncbi:uncharacterized protein EV420DRAFT_187751 [Desarmillaria tabescens]|uniref:Homeobox domain-containing protein n=1 Tax=Armillaria tabescens TaxID=1929756 RepID=A0AA39T381_ARMTA|nr:uncharacterized protein EV420DRAFT_187751 [Desarmillaria tabescens]KAK0461231.1 hypothetical protein EV420DRAFT_187751 [Desarmillaria tabescens]